MAIVQQLRWKCRMPEKKRFVHLFSSNSSNSNNNSNQEPHLPSPKDFTANLEDRKSQSHFSDVKASLRQQPASPPSPRSTPPPSSREHFPPTFHAQRQPSQVASLEEIRKNLSEFRRRSAAPLRSSPEEKKPLSSSSSLSFQDLYNRSVSSEQGENKNTAKLSFEAIRESLRHLTENENNNKFRGSDKVGQQVSSPWSLNTLKQSLKLQSSDPNAPLSHPFTRPPPGSLPPSMADKSSSDSSALKTEFVKMYSYGELGDKLRKLRPTAKAKNWFSFAELNERLKKLRDFEEKETESRIGGVSFKDLRESLVRLRMSSDASTKKSSIFVISLVHDLGVRSSSLSSTWFEPKRLLASSRNHCSLACHLQPTQQDPLITPM